MWTFDWRVGFIKQKTALRARYIIVIKAEHGGRSQAILYGAQMELLHTAAESVATD